MRGQHAIDIGELEENRRRLRDLAAKINHLEEANSELEERAKGLSKDMDTRSEQEKLEVKPSFEHIFTQFFLDRWKGGAYQESAGGQWEADGGLPNADAGGLKLFYSQRLTILNNFQTKTALDMEISLYRKLLESEEDRLGMATGWWHTTGLFNY